MAVDESIVSFDVGGGAYAARSLLRSHPDAGFLTASRGLLRAEIASALYDAAASAWAARY